MMLTMKRASDRAAKKTCLDRKTTLCPVQGPLKKSRSDSKASPLLPAPWPVAASPASSSSRKAVQRFTNLREEGRPASHSSHNPAGSLSQTISLFFQNARDLAAQGCQTPSFVQDLRNAKAARSFVNCSTTFPALCWAQRVGSSK